MTLFGEAPHEADAVQERAAIIARLGTATRLRDVARGADDEEQVARWSLTIDELLDRLGEVQGR